MQYFTPQKAHRRPLGWSSPKELSGSAQVFLTTFIALIFMAGGVYLYSVNRSAVQGYEMRSLEKNLETLKKENVALKVEEAEKSSLARVQAGSETLRMEKSTPTITLPLGGGTVAYR